MKFSSLRGEEVNLYPVSAIHWSLNGDDDGDNNDNKKNNTIYYIYFFLYIAEKLYFNKKTTIQT